MPELVIHNLPLRPSMLVATISEFSDSHPIVALDPTACASRCQLTVLPCERSHGRAMLRTRLAHTLRQQMPSKCFSVWWAVASDVPTLERCLYGWCDALDPSGSISLWEKEEAMRVLRAYPEQQRQWGRCCVLVLDECTNVALHFYLQHWCSRWGLQLYVLAQEPIDMAALRDLVPAAVLENVPRPLPLSDGDDASAFSDEDLFSAQFRTHFAPQMMEWVDEVRSGPLGSSSGSDSAELNNDEDDDDDDENDSPARSHHDLSYVNKAAELLNYRPVLLRFFAVYMQLRPVDTYTAFHDLKTHCTREEEAAKDFTSAAIRLVRSAVADTFYDTMAVLPVIFPRSFIPSTSAAQRVLDVLLKLGVASVVPSGTTASDMDLVKLSSWFQRRLFGILSIAEAQDASAAVVSRCTDLCVQFPLEDDVEYHALHEQMLLSSIPVPGSAENSIGSASSLVTYFDPAKRAEAIRMGFQYCSNNFIAALRGREPVSGLVLSSEEGQPDRQRRLWFRWGLVVAQAVSSAVAQRRLFVEIPVLFPPRVTRPFRGLFGVPALPSDEKMLTPQLAQLFRLYSKAHAAANDFISAAAAIERALCIYIGIFEAQAEEATKAFAEQLRARVQDATVATRAASMRRGSLRNINTGGLSKTDSSAAFPQRRGSRPAAAAVGNNSSGSAMGVADGAPFSHTFSLICLAVEDCYHEAALLYIAAGMAGIAESMIQRSVAMLELLHNNRRDTPGRAVGHARLAEVLLALGSMEEKRGSLIKHADYLDEDTSDMKLRERVRADVEARAYFRSAAAEASESLAALGRYSDDYLVVGMASLCEAIIARQQLTDYNIPAGMRGAEKALEETKVKLEKDPELHCAEIVRLREGGPGTMSLGNIVEWAHQNSACFIRAVQLGEYSFVHELLDRCPLLAVLGCLAPLLDDAAQGSASVAVGSMLQVIAVESEAADLLSEYTYPTPQPAEHLRLRTTFSDFEIASHHGRCWKKRARTYCLPAHELLLRCSPDDSAATDLLRRLLSLGYEQRSCSPHDMRTLLHIAVDRQLHSAVQCLMHSANPPGDALYAPPYCLASQRVGLSTVPTVSRVASTVPAALYTCRKNPRMLLALLFESKSPQQVFDASRVFVVEELSADQDRGMYMRMVLGKGAPFESVAPALLEEPALSSEAKEELAKLCGFRHVKTALLKRSASARGFDDDPYFSLVLCDRTVQTAPSAEEATHVLVDVATKIIRSTAVCARDDAGVFGVLLALLRKYPDLLSESTLYWDDVKTLEKCTGKRLAALQTTSL
jgi:hypothetical protein